MKSPQLFSPRWIVLITLLSGLEWAWVVAVIGHGDPYRAFLAAGVYCPALTVWLGRVAWLQSNPGAQRRASRTNLFIQTGLILIGLFIIPGYIFAWPAVESIGWIGMAIVATPVAVAEICRPVVRRE